MVDHLAGPKGRRGLRTNCGRWGHLQQMMEMMRPWLTKKKWKLWMRTLSRPGNTPDKTWKETVIKTVLKTWKTLKILNFNPKDIKNIEQNSFNTFYSHFWTTPARPPGLWLIYLYINLAASASWRPNLCSTFDVFVCIHACFLLFWRHEISNCSIPYSDIASYCSIPHRIHVLHAIYGVPWIPSIYPSHVSIAVQGHPFSLPSSGSSSSSRHPSGPPLVTS